MFLRFVVGLDGDDHRLLTGVVTEARMLRDIGALLPYEIEWLEDVFDWFNANLPVPPYSKNQWPSDVVAWFNSDGAREAIGRIWDLTALLRENGKNIRILRSKAPGYVWYQDAMQVVVTEF